MSARVLRCEANGDCFFQAVGCQIGIPARRLRASCVQAFWEAPREVRELIAASEGRGGEDGLTETEYAARLASNLFGGHNEMMLICNRYNATIYVYTRHPASAHSFRELTRVHPPSEWSPATHSPPSPFPSPVRILWDGAAHYDALLDEA